MRVKIFLDSDARIVDVLLDKSSGDETLDSLVLSNVMRAKFKPGYFLCTPVVSTFLLEMTYRQY